jgi:hypothetical protein
MNPEIQSTTNVFLIATAIAAMWITTILAHKRYPVCMVFSLIFGLTSCGVSLITFVTIIVLILNSQ